VISVVVDTNVLVSALISSAGNESFVISAVASGVLTPFYSNEILEEYRLVLSRTRFGFEETILEQLFLLLSTRGTRIAPREDTTVLSPDPDDRKFILCSLEASADFLVTGNRKHFPQAQYGKTAVVNARELLEHVLIRTSLPSKL
jgi:putative PIN family toxin of toxin-antitoxin system